MIEIIPNWHPMLVHFTIAMLTMSIIFFIIQKPFYETEIGDDFNVFARYSLFIGVSISVLTLIAGWFAFNSVDHDTPSHTAMLDHRMWAIITFIVFALAALWLLFSATMRETASIPFLAVLIIGGALLATTGYKGAELVYKHGLGVQSLPKASNHDHASGHEHGGDHGEAGHHDEETTPSEHSHDDGGHADSHEPELVIDAQSMADMESAMDAEPTPEPTPEPEPEVVVDKDGISKQTLPAEDMPIQPVEN